MGKRRTRLGQNLDPILVLGGDPAHSDRGGVLRHLALSDLVPNPYQPRTEFDEDSLTELAQSVAAKGVIQPLVVRQANDAYEVVAGERRWRAAEIAGLQTVPAVVRKLSDSDALGIALIENLQREDLNPIEEARALQRLGDEFGLAHQEIGDMIGRSRAAVSNLIRLLDLDTEVQQLLMQAKLDMGHARALVTVAKDKQLPYALQVVDGGLTVRQTEQLVAGKKRRRNKAQASQPEALDVPAAWQGRVQIRRSKAHGTELRLTQLSATEIEVILRWLRERDT